MKGLTSVRQGFIMGNNFLLSTCVVLTCCVERNSEEEKSIDF